ncbi:MAG: SDR family NAD(P)-dependent oxidoreductase, partial [Bacteroidota bacterium]
MHIIVTGASRGIGFELVQILAQDPSNQILALSRNIEKLEALCAPLDNASFIAYDLAKGTNQQVLDQLKEWGKLDLLVNNAGLLIKKGLERRNITVHDIKNKICNFMIAKGAAWIEKLTRWFYPSYLSDNNNSSERHFEDSFTISS